MIAVLTYEGYTLIAVRGGYQSEINGRTIKFDTASQWVQYIDKVIKRNG